MLSTEHLCTYRLCAFSHCVCRIEQVNTECTWRLGQANGRSAYATPIDIVTSLLEGSPTCKGLGLHNLLQEEA